MYSLDRRQALDATIACLKDMPEYDSIQKTLVVDGKTNEPVDDFDIVQVPRLGGFCWAYMWDAGVMTAQYDVVVYLDSDRLLPTNFLTLVKDTPDDEFRFPSRHFMMLSPLDLTLCKRFLANPDCLLDEEFIGRLRFEKRMQYPFHGPAKNVMSGSVAFTKKTFCRLGGLDPWYCGHGAYADSDFHQHAANEGCRFKDLDIPELHYPHDKQENGNPLDAIELKRLALDNFIYFGMKWGLSTIAAENLASECVPKAEEYVSNKLTEYAKEFV